MGKKILLDKSEVIIGVQFPIEITSVQRYQRILNSPLFQKRYGIKNMFFEQGESFDAKLGSLYFGRKSNMDSSRVLKNIGSIEDDKNIGSIDDELLSEEPIVAAYTDGGLEYLNGFIGQATDNPSYQNELIMPNNSRLTFCHPVKNKKLLELITK